MKFAGPLTACTLIVAAAMSASDAAIYSATTTHLSPGTRFDVAGGALGVRQTAALVTQTRRVPVKVLSVSDDGTLVRAVLVNVPRDVSGAATLEIQPRGVQLPSDLPGFTIEKPRIRAVGPSSGPKGTIVTIRGSYFGVGARDDLRPAGGLVLFGAKRAAVLSWNDGEIHVKAPKLKNGLYDVTVTNRTGSSTMTGAYVEGSAVPDDSQVRGTFGDVSFDAFGSAQINSGFRREGGTAGVVDLFCIVREAGVLKTFVMSARVDVSKPFPQTLRTTSDRSVAFTDGPTDGPAIDDYQTSAGGDATIMVTGFQDVPDGIFAGSFHGTLDQFGAAGGMGPAVVCDGTFWVRVGR